MEFPWRRLAQKGELEYQISVRTDLGTIAEYDLVVFQRQEMTIVEDVTRMAQNLPELELGIQSSWAAEGLAWTDDARIRGGKRAGRKVIFDIDDDALHVPDTNPNYLQWGKDARKIAWIVKSWRGKRPSCLQRPAEEIAARARANLKQLLKNIAAADAVTVTTPWLKQVYSKYNKRIYVLPNWAEPEGWKGVQPKEHEGIHIGWAGGPTHYGDLALVARPLIQTLQENPHVKFILCGFPMAKELLFAEIPEGQIVVHPFQADWKQNLATWDIILAPSESNSFNAGKSVIRLYEGLLATKGHAAVAGSPTTYGQAIKALGCGFACRNFGDWYRILRKLIDDEDLRKKKGRTGYENVLAHHTYEKNCHKWLEVYRKVLGN